MQTPAAKGPHQSARHAPDSKLELMLFRLGSDPKTGQQEIFGINVFKVREIVVAPPLTSIVNSTQHMKGLANVRGQLIPVIDLSAVAGCTPQTNMGIVLVTEFSRTTQAFMVDEMLEIVSVDWKNVQAADNTASGLVSGVARIDGDAPNGRLVQVLDVEQILRNVFPEGHGPADDHSGLPHISMPPGAMVMCVDDSSVARLLIEEALKAMHVPYVAAKHGKEAWQKLEGLAAQAQSQGKRTRDLVPLVLTDLEMPEMDGFTLTRNIKQDPRFSGMAVVVHSSLTGKASEGHAASVGADAYLSKFAPRELGETLRDTLERMNER